MTTEQGGAPSASAGGAPAPGPWGVGLSPTTGGRNLYVRGDSPDSDVYVGVIFEPADARRIVELMNAQWRADFAVDAEVLPADRKAVYSEPGIDTDWDEDADAMLIHGVGWSLSWGCKLSIARDHDTGEHYVCVSTSGQDQRAGITTRRTTKEQIASFGQQLLNVFGEPDPRDAEIERLRAELDRVSTGWQARLDARERLERERNDAVSEAARLRGICDQRAEEAYAKQQQLFTRFAELVNPIREVFGKSPVGASHYRELRDGINRLIVTLNGEREGGERLRGQVDELAKIRVALFAEVRQALGERDDLRLTYNAATERSRALAAERDRLRQELALIGEQRPKFQPEQRVRVGNGECFGTVHTTLERYTVEIDDVHFLVDLPPAFLTALPAEPRRWVAGDPEPEIGTTVTWGVAGATWSRHEDRDWRSDACACDSCLDAAGLPWSALLDAAATSGGLVEVVNSDGD